MKLEKNNINKFRLLVVCIAFGIALTMILSFALPANNTTPPRKITKVTGSVSNLKEIYRFKDVNDTQIVAAQNFGIEPLKSRSQLDSLLISELWLVESSNILKVDSLTHSVPYLTPGAVVVVG